MFEQLQLTKSFQFAARVMLMAVIPILILIKTSLPIDHALAQAPPPGGEQPDFTVTVQTAPGGR